MAQAQPQGLTWGKALQGVATVSAIGLAASAAAIGISDVGFSEVFESFGQDGKGLLTETGEAFGHVGDAFTGTEGKDGVFTNIGQFISNITRQVTEVFSSVTEGFQDGFGKDTQGAAEGIKDLHAEFGGGKDGGMGMLDKAAYNTAHLIGENPIPAAAIAGGAAVGAAALAANGNKGAKGTHSSKVMKSAAHHDNFADRIRAQQAMAAMHGPQK